MNRVNVKSKEATKLSDGKNARVKEGQVKVGPNGLRIN